MSNNFLAPPKIMSWVNRMDQHYTCDKKILAVSGASFTASTNQLKCAASWPGFLYDRCRFDQVIDLSYPGVGNEYIADSVMYFVEHTDTQQHKDLLVGVMWSGIGWIENKIIDGSEPPRIGNLSYQRKTTSPSQQDMIIDSQVSYEKILQLREYLNVKKIPFFFTNYANTLFPPCLPRKDFSCNFFDYLDGKQISELKKIPWLPINHKDCLYDYAFFNYDNENSYHPTVECNLQWTDNILLPALVEQKLITHL